MNDRRDEPLPGSGQPSPLSPGQPPPRWQFSIWTLLVATTLVAVYLTFAAYFPWAATVILTLSLIQATLIFGADWISGSRRRLAAATGVAWIAVGSILAAIGLLELIVSGVGIRPPSTFLSAILVGIGLVCYLVGWRRWRSIRKSSPDPDRWQ